MEGGGEGGSAGDYSVGGTMPVSHAMQERLHMARESSHCSLHFFFFFLLFFPSISPHAR